MKSRRGTLISLVLFPVLFLSCERMLIGPKTENTAINNFNILWNTLNQNYPLFTVKHVNWDSLYTVYRGKISENTTKDELWDLTSDLILNLNDAHVTIFNKDFSKVVSASYIMRTRVPNNFSLDLVKSKFLQNEEIIGNGNITYGTIIGKNIGYIYIASFTSSNSGNGYEWAYDIDKAVNNLSHCDALIVDVRNNGGGVIVAERIIISAFIDHSITYLYSRQKTGPGHDDLGEKIPITVVPRNSSTPFTKKIALLTNRFTGSGAEYLTEAFKNLSYATQIGDTTIGAFGEITNTSELPNGWTYRYPCTFTTTPDGRCLEGIGIVPDVLIENTLVDIMTHHDKVLEYAINYLSTQTK